MGVGSLLLNQIIIMFVLMAIGFLFYKINFITDQGSKDIGKILLYLVIPVVVVKNFMVEFTPENVTALVNSFVIALISMAIAILISFLVFGKKDGIANFASSFSNAGFIGIPLVSATIGSFGVFYLSSLIVLINILQWTYGIFIMTGDSSCMSFKKIITNPILISVLVGLVLFVSQIQLPSILTSTMGYITNLNTPLAMFSSGIYLAQSDLVAMFKKKNTYLVSLLRLIIIPTVVMIVFKLLPFGSVDMKMTLLIGAACPVGSNVAIFAQAHNKDYVSAVEQVCMTTIFCLLTLPVIMMIAEKIL